MVVSLKKDKFRNIKGVTRKRKSKKDRQYIDQKKKGQTMVY